MFALITYGFYTDKILTKGQAIVTAILSLAIDYVVIFVA